MFKNKVKIPPYLQIKQQKDAVQHAMGKWIVRQHSLEWKGDFIIIDGMIKISDDNLFQDISKRYNLQKPGIFSKEKTIHSMRKVVESRFKDRRFNVPIKLPQQFKTQIENFAKLTNEIFCGYEFNIHNSSEIWDITGINSRYTIDKLIFDENFNEKSGNIIYERYCKDEKEWVTYFTEIHKTIQNCCSTISYDDGPGLFFGPTNLRFSYKGAHEDIAFRISNLSDISKIREFDKKFIESVKNEQNKVLGSYISRSLFYYSTNKDYIELSSAKDCITCKFDEIDNKYIGFLKDYAKLYPTLNALAETTIVLKKYRYLVPYKLGKYKFNISFKHILEEYENNIDLTTLESKILSGNASDIEMEKMLNQYKNGALINPDVISIMCENFVFMALNQSDMLNIINL